MLRAARLGPFLPFCVVSLLYQATPLAKFSKDVCLARVLRARCGAGRRPELEGDERKLWNGWRVKAEAAPSPTFVVHERD